MTLISLYTFRTEMFNYAAQNYQKFKYFWPLGGGWEAWVQAEVAAYIVQKDSTYEIAREPRELYNNTQVPDWGLNLQMGGSERIAVELKCQRGRDLDGKTFVNEIRSDAQKLNAGNLPQGVKKLVVGIYYSVGAFDGIRQLHTLTPQNHNQYGGEVGVFVID
jgi:hypothetical protein